MGAEDRQAPAAATDRRVRERKPAGQEERQHHCEKRLAVATALQGGRFVLNIDDDGPVVARRFGRCAHVFPVCHQAVEAEETRWGERVAISRPIVKDSGRDHEMRWPVEISGIPDNPHVRYHHPSQ